VARRTGTTTNLQLSREQPSKPASLHLDEGIHPPTASRPTHAQSGRRCMRPQRSRRRRTGRARTRPTRHTVWVLHWLEAITAGGSERGMIRVAVRGGSCRLCKGVGVEQCPAQSAAPPWRFSLSPLGRLQHRPRNIPYEHRP